MKQQAPECQKIQQWLIDPMTAERQAEVGRHLAHCECCAAMHEEISAAGELLGAVAQSIENQFPTSLSPQLRERVRAESQARLARKRTVGEGSEAPSATFPGGTVLLVPAPQKRRGWTPMHWAAAAILTAMLGGLAIYGTLSIQDFGRLNFADGTVKIVRGGTETLYVGLPKQAAPLPKHAIVETDSASRALFTAGPAYVAVAPDSQVVIEGPESLRVARGEIWLQVNPAKNGFWVHTDHGAVRVTGTVFGVAAGTGATLVQVTDGTVVVSSGNSQTQVDEGQEVQANAGGVSAPAPRADGETRPEWIDQLNEKSARADDVQFLPTIAGNAK